MIWQAGDDPKFGRVQALRVLVLQARAHSVDLALLFAAAAAYVGFTLNAAI